MSNSKENYISLSEAAKLTNYSQEYISLLCRQKKMKGTKIGRNWVTKKEWVEHYINQSKGSGQNIVAVRIENKKSFEEKKSSAVVHSQLGVNLCNQNKSFSESEKKEQKINKSLSSNFFLFGKKQIIGMLLVCSLLMNSFIFLQFYFQKEENILNKIVKSFQSDNIMLFKQEQKIGRVAGIEDLTETEKILAEKKRLVIISLQEEINLQKINFLVETVRESFSDNINISPFDDGVSGIISLKNNPDKKYLYITVPVN